MLIKIRNLLVPVLRNNRNKYSVSHYLSTSAVPKEEKIKVGNCNINYVKVGKGAHNCLCLPGALGSIWTDYKPQLDNFDREKFTLVAWDPPGYGKSRPPNKTFTVDFFEREADDVYQFMKALNIPKYSLLGWSDGGITGMIHAAKYPDAVQKLVVWGSNAFILPQELEFYNKLRDVNKWSQKMKQPMIDIYGEEFFAKYWVEWIDGMVNIYNKQNGDLCTELLKDIKCPTFILYGEKDPIVDKVHVSHLHTHIEGSRIHLYPEGKHNIHLRYAEDFNKRVQEFLMLPQ